MSDKPKHAGDRCPKCGEPVHVEQNTLYFGGRSFAGLVCKPCNALWDNADDSMLAAATASQQEGLKNG